MEDLNKVINDEKTFLVDVRTPGEVAQKGVPGAENIPLDKIPQNLDIFKDAHAQGSVVVFCRSGARSEQAKNYLRDQGLDQVFNGGGIQEVLMHKM